MQCEHVGWIKLQVPVVTFGKHNNELFFSHSYRASWYYQSFIYSPTDAPVSCLKEQ